MIKIWIDMVLCSVTWRITQLPNNRKKYFYGVSTGKNWNTNLKVFRLLLNLEPRAHSHERSIRIPEIVNFGNRFWWMTVQIWFKCGPTMNTLIPNYHLAVYMQGHNPSKLKHDIFYCHLRNISSRLTLHKCNWNWLTPDPNLWNTIRFYFPSSNNFNAWYFTLDFYNI